MDDTEIQNQTEVKKTTNNVENKNSFNQNSSMDDEGEDDEEEQDVSKKGDIVTTGNPESDKGSVSESESDGGSYMTDVTFEEGSDLEEDEESDLDKGEDENEEDDNESEVSDSDNETNSLGALSNASKVKHGTTIQNLHDSSSDESSVGSENTSRRTKTQIGGKVIKLAYGNPLNERMEKFQPLLFKNEGKAGKYKAYSRMCPSVDKRQPVIINEAEKQMIDEKYPGSYDNIIEYSTNPNKEKYYYMCPKYWNFKEMVPVKEENVDENTLIPKGAKTADIDKHFVYKISDKEQIPGFLQKADSKKHGFYVPCCFKLKDGAKQAKIIKEAEEQMRMVEEAGLDNQNDIIEYIKEKQTTNNETKHVDYLLGGDKVPLPLYRHGVLPFAIQRFFGLNQTKKQVEADDGKNR